MAQILGVEPKIMIPKPIGARVTLVEIKTTLSVEEQYKRAGLVGVSAEDNRPRNTCGIIVALGRDPIVADNYSVGMGCWFYAHAGQHIDFQDRRFRTLDWNDILNTIEEEEVRRDCPEWVDQVTRFLLDQA